MITQSPMGNNYEIWTLVLDLPNSSISPDCLATHSPDSKKLKIYWMCLGISMHMVQKNLNKLFGQPNSWRDVL